MIQKTIWMIIIFTWLVVGCKTVPTAQAEEYSQPSTPDISAPEVSYQHEMRFDVRAGLRAQVTMSETRISVQVNHIPPVTIHRVNFPLLREWGMHYLKVNDYDRDGMNDLAILTTAGRGGKNLCYAVYRYNPHTGQFRQNKSFDRCGI